MSSGVNLNCRPILAAQECATQLLSLPVCHFADPEHPKVRHFQAMATALLTTVNFVCRDNVEGTSQLVYSSTQRILVRLNGKNV